jgi:hypothetical protein
VRSPGRSTDTAPGEPMRTSLEWRLYYEANARALLSIPWETGPDMGAEEISALGRSIAEFQAGESSEGRHLFGLSQEYAGRTGDHEYLKAIGLFIAEEQRHARDLGRVMTMNGIPLVRTTFTDRVFRRLRHVHRSLEVSVAVLITAEIIAKVYYRALRGATRSAVLQRLCDQILQDELRHVEFQAGQLHRLRAGRGRLPMAATMGLQRFLYLGTVVVVWAVHRPAIRRGGFTFGRWWDSCWSEFRGAFGRAAAEQSPDPAPAAARR